MASLYPIENWHNFRIVRQSEDTKLDVFSDFCMTLQEAAEDQHDNHGSIVDVVKVEWRGAHIGPVWKDVTEQYKTLIQGFCAVEENS